MSPASNFGSRYSSRSGGQVNLLDNGPHPTQAAKTIISMIRSRRLINRLIIGHNELGDEGCRYLFRFLCSKEGREYNIQEISLNSNGVGDGGLLAIAVYLQDNRRLRELFLQNNTFTGNLEVVKAFMAAVNSSRLRLLSLTANRSLSDDFLLNFLSSLDAPRLYELQLSAIGLTALSRKTIATYLSSHRCRLRVLKCNDNLLGLRAVKSIVRAIKAHNYSLRALELYTNRLQVNETGPGNASDSSDQQIEGHSLSLRTWDHCKAELKSALSRNVHLGRVVGQQAVTLLYFSRSLLLQSKHYQKSTRTERYLRRNQNDPLSSPVLEHKDDDLRYFAFRILPLELQQYILSFLAPSLSPAQLIRVFDYATSANTLPQLLPPLSALSRRVNLGVQGGMCFVPDPSSIEYALGGAVLPLRADLNSSRIFNRHERERSQFLNAVGCTAFETAPVGEGGHAARELYTLALR